MTCWMTPKAAGWARRTLLAINLGAAAATLRFDTSLGAASHAYVLGPSGDAASSLTKQAGLLGTGVTLNGKLLSASPNGTVAPLVAAPLGGAASAEAAPHSIGFYVFPEAYHPDCPWS